MKDHNVDHNVDALVVHSHALDGTRRPAPTLRFEHIHIAGVSGIGLALIWGVGEGKFYDIMDCKK